MSEKKMFTLLSVPEVLALPPAEWLIRPLFPTHAQVLLYASPESYKSFLALAWAFAVATGRPWLGHAVQQGTVIYVAREGIAGMKQRILAWQQAMDVDSIDRAFFLKDDLQLRTDCDLFIETIAPQKPSLVVIDTFSRTFVGADENNSKDVGEWVAASRKIQDQTGATVLTVHHTVKNQNKNGPVERGHSLLRGAMDTMLSLARQRNDNVVVLACEKQKDAEPFHSIALRSEVLEVGRSVDGDPIMSLVLARTDEPHQDLLPGPRTRRTTNESKVLDALRSKTGFDPNVTVTTAELITESGLEESPFFKAVNNLTKKGDVHRPAKGHYQLLATADNCRDVRTH